MTDDFAPLKPAPRWEPKAGDTIEVKRVHYDAYGDKVENWISGKVVRISQDGRTFKAFMIEFAGGDQRPVPLTDMRAAHVVPAKARKP